VVPGGFFWHPRLADAQAQARSEGKLLLISSTNPTCSLCKKFKNEVMPRAGGTASEMAVGYIIQTHLLQQRPEDAPVWSQLKANLTGKGLMPLVGVFTPDLRYLTGFAGPTDLGKLMGALRRARGMYPVSAPAPHAYEVPGGRTAAVQLNEYGEYEWTPLDELYPTPEDALTPETTVAAETVLPPAAPAAVATLPVEMVPPPPAPPAPASVTDVASYAPAVVPPRPVAVMPPAPPVPAVAPRPRPPFSREPEPALETWGAEALRKALRQIREGDLAAAKSTLAEIHARLPGSTLAREAAKGTVAVYNADRIAAADGSERERLRKEAERNLGQSMWGDLFRS
jgi:hypothetical protein